MTHALRFQVLTLPDVPWNDKGGKRALRVVPNGHELLWSGRGAHEVPSPAACR